MKPGRYGWKFIAVLVASLATTCVALPLPGRTYLIAVLVLGTLALGHLEYAFGFPRLPTGLWRVAGPMFSLLFGWKCAVALGWLGTRLAIRPLTMPEQISTLLAALCTVAGFLIVCVPLLRLGQWPVRWLSDPYEQEELAAVLR